MANRLQPCGDGVEIADTAFSLPFPPTSVGLVPAEWSASDLGAVPELDLRVWGNAAIDLTAATVYAGALASLVVADFNLTGVANATDTLTKVAHGLLTGDGPIRFTNAGGALPAGLAVDTDYFAVKVDNDNFKVASTRENALAGTVVNLTSDGTGTHTVVDTADTKRVHWHSLGLLGSASDGALSVGAQLAYAVRLRHHPNAIAYALSATLSVSDPEGVSAAFFPIQER